MIRATRKVAIRHILIHIEGAECVGSFERNKDRVGRRRTRESRLWLPLEATTSDTGIFRQHLLSHCAIWAFVGGDITSRRANFLVEVSESRSPQPSTSHVERPFSIWHPKLLRMKNLFFKQRLGPKLLRKTDSEPEQSLKKGRNFCLKDHIIVDKSLPRQAVNPKETKESPDQRPHLCLSHAMIGLEKRYGWKYPRRFFAGLVK